MIWLFAALGNSVLAAGNAEINRRYKQESFRLNLWRTLFVSLFWLPFAINQTWPRNPFFYLAAVFCGVGIVIGNTIMNDLAARHNGRVAVLHLPLKALVVFVLWPLVDVATRDQLLHEQPWRSALALACFGTMVLAVNAMRRNDASWGALRALVPVIVMYSLADIAGRLVLEARPDLMGRMIVYLFIATGVSAAASIAVFPWRPRPELPVWDATLLKVSAMVAVVAVFNHMCFYTALTLAPNPAYVSMIALIAPAWLFAYHKVLNIPDHASPWASVVLVLGAVGLLLVTL